MGMGYAATIHPGAGAISGITAMTSLVGSGR